jgi:hypothetical protein
MKTRLFDKLLLILTALGSLGFAVFLGVYLESKFSKGWKDFIMMSIGYLIALQYLPFTSARLRRIPKYKIILFQTVMAALTIGISYLVFKMGVLPFPERTSIYVIGMIPLAAGSMVFLDYCVKKWKFLKPKKDNKKTNEIRK